MQANQEKGNTMSKNLVNLNEFEEFNAGRFLEGKTFEAAAEAESLPDFNTGEIIGTRVTVEITGDKTKYRNTDRNNIGARFDVKILGKDVKDYAWVGYRVPLVVADVTDVKRWSQRDGGSRNQLTVMGDVQKAKA